MKAKRECPCHSGQRYAACCEPFTRVGRAQTEVGIDDRPDPITITVSTADLIAAIEEWAAHLEHKLKTAGSYF